MTANDRHHVPAHDAARLTRRQLVGCVLVLVLAPLALLGPSLLGPRTYVPWDVASFPPVATTLTQEQRAQIDLQPAHWEVSEIPVLVLPEIELARRELAEGRFPHWNPYARFGAPLFANSLAAMCYPPNWLLLIPGDPRAGLAATALLSFAIAGLLMFGFLRALRIGPLAAVFGGLAFAFSGTLAVNGHFYMRMNALIWVPGMLWACTRLQQTTGAGRVPAALGLAACMGMTFLAGFPPFAAASAFVVGVFAAIIVVREQRLCGIRSSLQLAGWLAGGAALGFGFAAVQLLPMLAYFPESNRDLHPPFAAVLGQRFEPMGFLGLVLPDAFGHTDASPPACDRSPLALLLQRANPVDGTLTFPVSFNYTEYTLFPGTLVLLLGIFAILGPAHSFRRAAIGIGAALVLLATAPALTAFVYRLPFLSTVSPMRFIGPFCVVLAILAALGFDAMLRGARWRRVASVAGVAFAGAMICAGFALASPLSDPDQIVERLLARYEPQTTDLDLAEVERLVGPENLAAAGPRLERNLWRAAIALATGGAWLLVWRCLRGRAFAGMAVATVVVCALELIAFALPLNRGRTLDHAYDSEIHAFLRERRDLAKDRGGITVARAAKVPRDASDLPPSTLFPERIRDLNSYAFVDHWSHEAFVRLYGEELMIRHYWPRALPDDERLALPFFDLIGLRYILSSDRLEHAGAQVAQIEGPGGTFSVYERPSSLPRAFVVHALDVVDPGPGGDETQAVLDRLLRPEFDPRDAVVVTPDGAADLPLVAPTSASRAVRFVTDAPTEIALEVADGPAGYLVLADSFMSGWSVEIDGEPASIARGNLFMRTVAIPAGAVDVRFWYSTPGLFGGAILTILSLLGSIALGSVVIRRSRPSRRD